MEGSGDRLVWKNLRWVESDLVAIAWGFTRGYVTSVTPGDGI